MHKVNEDLLPGIVGSGVLDLVRVNDVEGPVHLVAGLGIDPRLKRNNFRFEYLGKQSI